MHLTDRWPTPAYPPTPAEERRARREAVRHRLGCLVVAALALAVLVYGCWPAK